MRTVTTSVGAIMVLAGTLLAFLGSVGTGNVLTGREHALFGELGWLAWFLVACAGVAIGYAGLRAYFGNDD